MSKDTAVFKDYVRRYRGPGLAKPIRPWFRDFHRLRMEGDYDYPVHQHSEYEVILVESGPYRCLLNEQEVVVPENHVLVIKPGDFHSDSLVEGQVHYVLHFSVDPGLFHSDVTVDQQKGTASFAEGLRFFAELEDELKQSDPYSSALQDALLETFFWRLVRLLPEESLSASFRAFTQQQQFLQSLYAVFDEYHKENASVDVFADALEVSRRTLSTRCRDYLNESPAQAFARFRIDKACDMLKHTEGTVQSVAYELGFTNAFNFSRTFKQVKGISPSQWRG